MNLPIQLQAGLYLYLICINMITIAVYGIDKRNAVHGKWRIRVSTLLTLAAVGGSAGALLAMHLSSQDKKKEVYHRRSADAAGADRAFFLSCESRFSISI